MVQEKTNSLSISEIAALNWEEHPENPVISPKKPASYLGDPTVIPPEKSPDGKYHLFAQGELGIVHYSSADGESFGQVGGVAVVGGLRPFIMKDEEAGDYALFYEKADVFSVRPSKISSIAKRLSEREPGGKIWAAFLPENLHLLRTHIEARKSGDLRKWTSPVAVLEPDFRESFERDPGYLDNCVDFGTGKGGLIFPLGKTPLGTLGNVGNPTVVRSDAGDYLLYASAGQTWIPDCGFYEPKHAIVARAGSLLGPYSGPQGIIASPKESDPFCNLASGGFRVLRGKDGYVAFQNGIFADKNGNSSSQLRLLASDDGISGWSVLKEGIISPGEGLDYVYTAHPLFSEGGGMRAYYNARRGKAQPGTEEIRLALGKP